MSKEKDDISPERLRCIATGRGALDGVPFFRIRMLLRLLAKKPRWWKQTIAYVDDRGVVVDWVVGYAVLRREVLEDCLDTEVQDDCID